MQDRAPHLECRTDLLGLRGAGEQWKRPCHGPGRFGRSFQAITTDWKEGLVLPVWGTTIAGLPLWARTRSTKFGGTPPAKPFGGRVAPQH